MVTNNIPTTSHIRIGSSCLIDFAFWVLVNDGLHAPPFDKHPLGNHQLQNCGMNAQSWLNWLKLILIRHDNRFSWQVSNTNTLAQEKIQSLQRILEASNEIHNIDCNQEWRDNHQQGYLQELIQQEQGYQAALSDYLGLDLELIRESNPPQLWQDGQAVQTRLTRLWDEYQSLKYSNQFINDIFQTPLLWNVESNPPTNNYKEIYLVDYPHEVEMFIPPIFCIVTVPNNPINQRQLESRIFRIIQA